MPWKGGEKDASLGKGQDGFNIPSHTTTYQNGETTVEVGRDESVNTNADNRKGVA